MTRWAEGAMAEVASDKQHSSSSTNTVERVPFRLTGPVAAAARRIHRLEAPRSRHLGSWVAAVGDRARRRIGWHLPLTLVTAALIVAAVGLSYRSQVADERASVAAGIPNPEPVTPAAGPPAAPSTISVMTSGTDGPEDAAPGSAPPAGPGRADHGALEPTDAGFLSRQWGPGTSLTVPRSDGTGAGEDAAPRPATTVRRSPTSAVSAGNSPATTTPTTAAPATPAPTSAPTTAPPTTPAPTTAAPTPPPTTPPPTTRPTTTRPPTTPAPTRPAPGPNCGLEGSIRSREGRTQLSFSIFNQTSERLQVYWLDYDGRRVSYGGVSAGNSMNRSSYRTHPWVLTYPDGTCALLIPDPTDGQRFTVG